MSPLKLEEWKVERQIEMPMPGGGFCVVVELRHHASKLGVFGVGPSDTAAIRDAQHKALLIAAGYEHALWFSVQH